MKKLLKQVSEDVRRYQDATTFIEEINFRVDSGYDLSTIYRRAEGCIRRAFRQAQARDQELGLRLENLPHFKSNNRLVITIEVLPPLEEETKEETKEETAKEEVTKK